MLREVEQLLVLQDRDRKVRRMKTELKMAPAERAELEQRLASSSTQADGLKQKGRELEVEKKKLEVEAQAKRDSINRFKTQQFQTRKNEEFQALTNEIKRFEDDIQKLEDRELELMMDLENLRPRIVAAEKEASEGKDLIQRQLIDLEAKIGAIEAQLGSLESDRRQLAADVDEDLLSRYERLFASKGDAAVVPLEHEVCMGCHMKITTQTAVRVKAKKEIVSCEQCGRILYPGE